MSTLTTDVVLYVLTPEFSIVLLKHYYNIYHT
jgi:hypothetical protein